MLIAFMVIGMAATRPLEDHLWETKWRLRNRFRANSAGRGLTLLARTDDRSPTKGQQALDTGVGASNRGSVRAGSIAGIASTETYRRPARCARRDRQTRLADTG